MIKTGRIKSCNYARGLIKGRYSVSFSIPHILLEKQIGMLISMQIQYLFHLVPLLIYLVAKLKTPYLSITDALMCLHLKF